MSEVIVYHNPDSMGYPASEVTGPEVLTDKRLSDDAVGDRIWLLTGEGQPRRFFLRGVFKADCVESGEDEGFRTRVRGSNAKFFDPMIELTNREWFRDLKRSQGNFAFGYQTVSDPRFVRGLESAILDARPASDRASRFESGDQGSDSQNAQRR